MKRIFHFTFMTYLLFIIGCSNPSQKGNPSSSQHLENGWYTLRIQNKDTLIHEPIVTVKDFVELKLDSCSAGNYYITGKVSKHKQQVWAEKTAQSVGHYIGFVFQDSIITAPRVNASIKSGMFQLTFASDHPEEVCTLYQNLRKEKIDSITALFKTWEKDTTFTKVQQDSIIFSLDYIEAQSWLKMSAKPEADSIQKDTVVYLESCIRQEQKIHYTNKELQQILKELGKRILRCPHKKITENVWGWYSDANGIVVQLNWNTPEIRTLFRQEVMDSPAIRFDGEEKLKADNRSFTSDTLGIKLQPVYAAYADTASYATFILQNQSQHTIECGEAYHITFEKEPGDWYELPVHDIFNSIAYLVDPSGSHVIKAYLSPYVLPNKPGQYRLFYEVSLTKSRKRIQLMTEFKLSDQEEEFKTAPQIEIHKKQSKESNVVETEYIPSE